MKTCWAQPSITATCLSPADLKHELHMQKGRLMRGGREKCFLKLTAQPLTACANTAFSDYQREKQENSQLICHNSVFLFTAVVL